MNCDDARRLIEELVDGRLASADEVELRDHCAACPDCSASLGAADSFVAEVSASFLAARERAPSDLPKRVMRAVAAERGGGAEPRVPRVVWIGAAAAVAAVAAAVIVAVALPDGRLPEGDAVAGSRNAGHERRDTQDIATLAAGDLEMTRAGSETVFRPAPGAALLAGDTLRASGDEPTEIALPDGTRLFLDVGSEAVLVPGAAGPSLAGRARSVRLVAGRLFAEVEKDAEPFVVTTAFGNVTTLGTKFGVALEKGEGGETELAVSVEEGAVRVESEGEREVVRAGNGCVFRGGRCARRQSGDQCRERFRWMAQHRERCGKGRQGGQCGGMRQGGGGHGPGGKGPHAEGRDSAGGPRRLGREQGRGEARRNQGTRDPDKGPGHSERRREGRGEEERREVEEQTRLQARKRAEHHEQAEARRRAEEQKRAEEERRAEEEKRAEEQKRAEEERRAEEQRRAEEERRGGGSGRGSGGGGRGNGGGGSGSGRGGRRGR